MRAPFRSTAAGAGPRGGKLGFIAGLLVGVAVTILLTKTFLLRTISDDHTKGPSITSITATTASKPTTTSGRHGIAPEQLQRLTAGNQELPAYLSEYNEPDDVQHQDQAQQQQQDQQQQQPSQHSHQQQDETTQQKQQHQEQHQKVATSQTGPCGELTKEFLAAHAQDNTVVMAASSHHMFETFGRTWLHHLQRAHQGDIIIMATDPTLVDELSGLQRVACIQDFISMGQGEYRWGSRHYKQITWSKVKMVAAAVELGFNVLFTDMDVVWFRDPLAYFRQKADHVDFAISSDHIAVFNMEVGDDGLEPFADPHTNYNTGIYFVRGTEGGRRIMADWLATGRGRESDINDQEGFYEYLRSQPVARDKQGIKLYSGAATMGALPVSVLLNGYSYYIEQLHRARQVQPLGLHLTWVSLSKEGKLHRIKDAGLYVGDSDYYEVPRLLSVSLSYPALPAGYNYQAYEDPKFVDDRGGKMIMFHLQAMAMQMQQLYQAISLALLTNRTLVLPRLQCYCYKGWFGNTLCRIPGDTTTRFPFDCTLEQFLRPKALYRGFNMMWLGQQTRFSFRERPFLRAAQLQQHLQQLKGEQQEQRASIAVVTATNDVSCKGKIGCVVQQAAGASSGAAYKQDLPAQVLQAHKVKHYAMPVNMTDRQVLQALQSLDKVPLLHIENPGSALAAQFSDATAQRQLQAWLQHNVTSHWCCFMPHEMKMYGLQDKADISGFDMAEMKRLVQWGVNLTGLELTNPRGPPVDQGKVAV